MSTVTSSSASSRPRKSTTTDASQRKDASTGRSVVAAAAANQSQRAAEGRPPPHTSKSMDGSQRERASGHIDVKERRGTATRQFSVPTTTPGERAGSSRRDTPKSATKLNVVHCDVKGRSTSATRSHLTSLLSETFLPEGYPQSVTEDYIHYQTWDTIQALCSSVTGTLSTRSILRGVGVGSAEANLVSGTLSWALRDGMSMVSRILFASRVATDLDHDAKRWRYVADITNDIALTIEIFSSYLPHPWMFLTAICVASLFKAVTGVAGGGSKASLTHHFALRDNTADLSAKEGSQETAAGMIGVVLGMLTAWLVPDDQYWYTLMVVSFFTCAHLFSNYQAVTSLVLRYFNKQRFGIVVGEYLRPSPSSSGGGRRSCALLSPRQVRGLEGVLSYHRIASEAMPPQLMIGAALSDFLQHLEREKRCSGGITIERVIEQTAAALESSGYALYYVNGNNKGKRQPSARDGTYWLFFSESHPAPSASLGGLFHVMFDFQRRCSNDVVEVEAVCHLTSTSNSYRAQAAAEFQTFSARAEDAGWLMNRAQLRLEGWGVEVTSDIAAVPAESVRL